ncbi:DMT family transporter [Paracoccus sp. P2]|uniref:DMT family transporter n=1 Tax=Paracoccus sp. P2 TaxID=3248840 RepID=UPI00391F5BD9
MAGVLMMLAGIAFMTINDAFSKALTERYPPLQIVFLRNLVAFPVALAITLKMGGPGALRSHRPYAHLVRGILWIGAALLFVTSMKYLGLAEATTLIFIGPLIITAISAIFFGERVGWKRWFAVVSGFVGVIIVIRPGSATFQLASLLPIAMAFVYATLMVGARWVDPRDSVWTLMLYLTGVGAILSGLAVPLVWVQVHAHDFWLFIGLAAAGTAGMTMVTQAFRLASAVVIAPLEYSALLWAVGLGWLIWNDVPDIFTLAGAIVIVFSGMFILFRENTSKA